MTNQTNLDEIRQSALARMERTERFYKLAILGAALLESFLLIGLLLLADLTNRTHLLLFLATIGVYSVLGLGIIALGAFTQRNTLRILHALSALRQP